MSGGIRFGPDTKYISPLDYSMDDSSGQLIDKFYNSIIKFLPNIEKDKLYLDYTGIRPKLSGPNDPVRDFIIEEESSKGYPGIVNLVGIESPGLTSSLAIGELVLEKLGYKNSINLYD